VATILSPKGAPQRPQDDDYYCTLYTEYGWLLPLDVVATGEAMEEAAPQKTIAFAHGDKGRAMMSAWRVSPRNQTICTAENERLCMTLAQNPGSGVMQVELSMAAKPARLEMVPLAEGAYSIMVGGPSSDIGVEPVEGHPAALEVTRTAPGNAIYLVTDVKPAGDHKA
jgi:hypothetical protein